MDQTKDEKLTKEDLLKLTSRIVTSHVSNNMVASGDLAGFIKETYQNLDTLANPVPTKETPVPAVPIKQSVKNSYLICLECGKRLQVLKRHLRSEHDMEIADYIEKWELTYSYPTVAPDYAERRSNLAKEIGLGQGPRSTKKSSTKKAAATAEAKSTAKKGRKPAEDFEEDETPNASASDEDTYEENEQVVEEAEEEETETETLEASADDVEEVEGDEGEEDESLETVEDYERVPDDHYAE